MSIAKAVVTGTVARKPQTGYSQNNIAVSAFVLDIGEREEMFVRVISRRQALDEIVQSLDKGDRILVEGRLQTATSKMDDGSEKRIYELDANTIEKMNGEALSSTDYSSSEDVVKFGETEDMNELISEDEIPF